MTPEGMYAVMYLELGSSREQFSEPIPHGDSDRRAHELAAKGYTVVAIVTAEHAEERKAMFGPDGSLMEGAHLRAFLNDVVRRFRQDYPGVPQESALEAISLLCTLHLEGEKDLQNALLDEVHAPTPAGAADWRQHIRRAIANRRLGDGQ